jgi:hypothetical protein
MIHLNAMALLACSGPGAGKAMAEAEAIGYWNWVVSAAIAAAGVGLQFRDWRRRAIILGVGMVLHPGWWFSARMGDCGEMLRVAACIGTGAILLLAILPLRLANWTRPVPTLLAEPFGAIPTQTHRGRLLAALGFVSGLLALCLLMALWSPRQQLIEPAAIKRVQMGMTKQEVQQAVGRDPDQEFAFGGRIGWEWREGRSNFGVTFDEQGFVYMKHHGVERPSGFGQRIGEWIEWLRE